MKVARHTGQLIDDLPYVQILDTPVPQMVDSAMDFFRRLDLPVAEQVIDVPTISSSSSCPSRAALSEPLMVEQLVEVPTILSYSLLQRTTEQHVDIPVPHGRVQGSLPGQSSTTISSGKRVSERTVEQIVDIPSSGGSFAHGSSSSAGPADEDFTGVFRTFPRGKKVRVPPRVRVRECLRTRAHGRRRLIRRPVAPTSGLSSTTTSRARPTTGTDVLVCPPGSLLRPSRSAGSASGTLRVLSTSGIRKHVPVLGSSLLFLLNEELHRQLRAV